MADVQCSNVTFSSVTGNTLTVSWTRGNGSGCILVAGQGNSGAAAPVDNTSYAASEPSHFGAGAVVPGTVTTWYILYNTTSGSPSVQASGFSPGTEYIFQAIEYRTGVGDNIDYFTTSGSGNPATQTMGGTSPVDLERRTRGVMRGAFRG